MKTTNHIIWAVALIVAVLMLAITPSSGAADMTNVMAGIGAVGMVFYAADQGGESGATEEQSEEDAQRAATGEQLKDNDYSAMSNEELTNELNERGLEVPAFDSSADGLYKCRQAMVAKLTEDDNKPKDTDEPEPNEGETDTDGDGNPGNQEPVSQ